MAENSFEEPKASSKGDNTLATGKIGFTGQDLGEHSTEPLSLLSISGIDASKIIKAMKEPSAEELASSSPLSRQRAELVKKVDLLGAMSPGDSIKNIYEDGVLKLYDDAGKSHIGFKFMDPISTSKERPYLGAARKEKLEDLLGITLQFRKKF
ncbi:hypothetical protein BH11CYA1_BH11CYA1_47470 [soil metagenome]